MDERRIKWIDSARGIAITLVVLGHVIGGYTGNYTNLRYQNIVKYGLTIVYSFHMPLFFMISGYVYALKKNVWDIEQYKNYLLKKAYLLLIPYFVCSIGQILIKLPLQGRISSVLSWRNILLLPIIPVDQYWYIYVLFFIFCIQPFFEIAHKESLWLALIMLLLGKMLVLYGGDGVNEWCAVPIKVILFYFYFYVGIILRRKNIHYSKKQCVFFVMAFGLTMFISLSLEDGYTLVSTGLSIVLALFGALMIISLSQSVSVVGNSSILDTFGKSSMMIYIIHVLLCAAIRIVLLKLHVNNFYVSIVIGVILSLIIPTIMDKYWKLMILKMKRHKST